MTAEYQNEKSELKDGRPSKPIASPELGRFASVFGWGVVVVALVSAFLTFLLVGDTVQVSLDNLAIRRLFGFNIALVVLLVIVVAWQSVAIVRARRAGVAGAGLHVRIVGLFGLVAVVPAVLVAIVASVTLDRVLEPWFTGDVKTLIDKTREVATSFRQDECRGLGSLTRLMAVDLERNRLLFNADRNTFRQFFMSRADALGFTSATLLEEDGTVLERYSDAPFQAIGVPSEKDRADATYSAALCLIPWGATTYRSLIKIPGQEDWILFVAREVRPNALEYKQAAERGVQAYGELEQKNAATQSILAAMFAMIALIVLLSAIWFGVTLANALMAPVRRLIHATDQVATGNFYVQVPVRQKEGDLAHLGETFNKMTSELRQQRDSLMEATDLIDKRRRFTETVLSGVSAGVIGIDGDEKISIVNSSSEALLQRTANTLIGEPLAHAAPELVPLVEEARFNRQKVIRQQIIVSRGGRERILNVRVSSEQTHHDEGDLVITIDDITDLVQAQRTSAWADVARRIAHEIKNPLTPIQLSAERIRRKYGKVIVEDRQVFDQCTETIVRQVDDIKRMVDEFSSFARMPKSAIGEDDLSETVRQAVFLARIGHPDIKFRDYLPLHPITIHFDRRLVSQALTNILKNAAEAIAAVPEGERGQGEIAVTMAQDEADGNIVITVDDNGKGFPSEGRQRLLEPYMTTREGGTGLGLAIVSKILEDHGGGIELLDNPKGRGGRVKMWLAPDLHELKKTEDRSDKEASA